VATSEWRCHWTGVGCNSGVGVWEVCECSGSCFVAGTTITMGDGTTKPIEKVREGDVVLAWDEATKRLVSSFVTKVHEPYQVASYFRINGKIGVTGTHPFLTDSGWVKVEDLLLGAQLVAGNGLSTPLLSIERQDETVFVYNIAVEVGTYIAEELIVHNKDLPYEQQQPCPPDCEPHWR
jgi:hypothetical protein